MKGIVEDSYCINENFIFQEYVNPKSMTIEQLYGEFNQKSAEWVDGVVSAIFRTFANDDEGDYKWVHTLY